MRVVKGFGYNPIKDSDVIEYIDNQPLPNNQYIWGLVRKDMEGLNEIEIKIKEYVDECLRKYEIKEKKEDVVQINKDNILSVLNMK